MHERATSLTVEPKGLSLAQAEETMSAHSCFVRGVGRAAGES